MPGYVPERPTRRRTPGTHIYWTTNGEAGYPVADDERADGLRCPHCAVLFALDDDDSILAVIHELDCPAGQ